MEHINVRIQGVNNFKHSAMIGHNLRFDFTRNQLTNDKNYIFDLKTKETLVARYFTNEELNALPEQEQQKYLIEREKLKNYKDFLNECYDNDRVEHNKLFKNRRQKNLDDSIGSWGEAVITFPASFGDKYRAGELDLKDFVNSGIDAMRNINKYLGAEIISVQVHLDEKTPHFHAIFKNFDERGMSLTHNENLKKKGLSKNNLQDIGAASFKQFGLERGIPKAISGKGRHKKTKDFHNEQIAALNKEQHNLQNNLQQRKIEYKNEINFIDNDIKTKSNSFNEQLKTFEKEIHNKQIVLADINAKTEQTLKTQEKAKKVIDKALNVQRTNKAGRSAFVNKIIEAEKKAKLAGYGPRSKEKYENYLNELYDEFAAEAYLHKHTKSELQQAKQEIKELKTLDIVQIHRDIDNLTHTIKDLQNDNNDKDKTIKHYEKKIKEQNIEIEKLEHKIDELTPKKEIKIHDRQR